MSKQIKKNTASSVAGCIAAVLAAISLIVYLIYSNMGGVGNQLVLPLIVAGILVQVVLFFYHGKLADILAIIPAATYMFAMMLSIEGGVGNIADAVNDILMFGIKELAIFNYIIAGGLVLSTLVTIVSCFMTKEIEK